MSDGLNSMTSPATHENTKKVFNTTGNLADALAKAQAKYKPLKKSREAVIKMKNGGEYKYNYADLSDMIDATRDALSANGLAISQLLQKGVLETRLMHSSGEELVAISELPGGVSIQEFGSQITYIRRYALGPMLGIAGEDDDDGRAAQDGGAKTAKSEPKKTAPLPPAQSLTLAMLNNLLKAGNTSGYDKDEIASLVMQSCGCAPKDMTRKQFDEAMTYFTNTPNPNPKKKKEDDIPH